DVITINDNGVATAGYKSGPATITAIHPTKSKVTATAKVTLKAPALKTITISPANPPPIVGGADQQQFTATGLYADGASLDLTSKVMWKSLAPNIISIGESSGLASMEGNGSATITATDKTTGIHGSTELTGQAPGTGFRKIDVHVIVNDFKGRSMNGYQGYAVFSSPGAKDVTARG